MHAEIIAIGSELTDGAKLDTNSRWLSIELAAVGITVARHTTLADDLPTLVAELRGAAKRSAVVIITGGLGPTLDDLTRQAMADAAGVPLVSDPASLQHLRDLFASRGRLMPERNVLQAMFPAGAVPIPNPNGTAPGIWQERSHGDNCVCHMIALPGVPREMQPMFRDSVLPRLPASGRVIRQYRIHCFGAGESAIEEQLGDITARGHMPEVGITASQATITLRITTIGETAAQCDTAAVAIKDTIYKRLGDLIFGEDDTTLQDVVIASLRARNETLAVLETPLTGGQMTAWLAALPDADGLFRGGCTVPSDMLTAQLSALSLPSGLTDPVAAATLTRDQAGATWGLACIGKRSGAGGVIAVTGPAGSHSLTYESFGDAVLDRARAAKTALNLLRLVLQRS